MEEILYQPLKLTNISTFQPTSHETKLTNAPTHSWIRLCQISHLRKYFCVDETFSHLCRFNSRFILTDNENESETFLRCWPSVSPRQYTPGSGTQPIVNEQAVRILLECILVFNDSCFLKFFFLLLGVNIY